MHRTKLNLMLFGSLGSSAGLGASGAELGASGVCFPLGFNFSKILIYSFKFTSLVASDTGLGASGAVLGASGVCFPLESNFSKMLMACDLDLGASDVELGAIDLDLPVEGSSFPKIQLLFVSYLPAFPFWFYPPPLFGIPPPFL